MRYYGNHHLGLSNRRLTRVMALSVSGPRSSRLGFLYFGLCSESEREGINNSSLKVPGEEVRNNFSFLIWKAFQNKEDWSFPFWNIFFSFRDIYVVVLCKWRKVMKITFMPWKEFYQWITDCTRSYTRFCKVIRSIDQSSNDLVLAEKYSLVKVKIAFFIHVQHTHFVPVLLQTPDGFKRQHSIAQW